MTGTPIAGACLGLIMVNAAAQAQPCPDRELRPLVDAKDRVRQFVVSEPVPAEGKRHALPLGTVMVAVGADDPYVWLAHYKEVRDCVTEIAGPVLRTHLIEGVDAMTVGEVARDHPELAERLRQQYPLASRLIHENNGIELRTLLPPETRTRPRVAPREDAPENKKATIGDTYFWRYVMGIRKDDEGNRWLLLSTHSRVHDSDALDTRTSHAQEGQFRIQGWVPEKNLHPWPTNVVLELNAHRDAVAERLREYVDPAAIIRKLPRRAAQNRPGSLKDLAREEGIEVLAKEAPEFWEHAFRDEDERSKDNPYVAQFLPQGLRASTVRVHVQAGDEGDGWVRGATLAGIDGEIDYAEWIKVQRAMVRVIENLSKIEVLIVLDSTGSVKREIDDIGQALRLLNERLLRTSAGTAGVRTKAFRTLREIVITELPIDVRVSLMIFSHQGHEEWDGTELVDCRPFEGRLPKTRIPRTAYVFRGLSVRNEIARIQKGVRTARCIVDHGDGGDEEATLYALRRAVSDRHIWGDRMIGQQVIVLVTDEYSTKKGMEDAITPQQLAETVREVSRSTREQAQRAAGEAGYAKLEEHGAPPEMLRWLETIPNSGIRDRLREELEAREITLFRGSLIFTGEEARLKELQLQLAPSGLFSESRTYWSDLEAQGSRAEFAFAPEAIGRTIEEEQIRLVSEAVTLEKCALDPAACKADILRLPSQGMAMVATSRTGRRARATYRAAIEGIEHKVLAEHLNQGYVTGYTRIRDGEGRRATWSRAVMVTERQMRDYVRILEGMLHGIDGSFTDAPECDWDYKELGRILLFFQSVVREPPTTDEDGIRLARQHFEDPNSCSRGDQLFKQGYEGPIGGHLGIPAAMSANAKGVFGLPIETIRQKIWEGEINVAELLQRIGLKVLCLRSMQSNGRLLDPQALDPDEPEPWRYCDSGEHRPAHDWSVRLSHRYGGEYIFIPMHLLP